MLITTTDTIPDKKITETLGLVKGQIVQSKHIGKDVMAGLKTIVGGEMKGYTEMIAEAREYATKRMIEEAEKLGADAVIGLRFSSSAITPGAAEILAYGTAVKFNK